MSINFKNCTEEELWKFVGKHLADNGFDAVLVGKAHKFNSSSVKRWCDGENAPAVFKELQKRVRR